MELKSRCHKVAGSGKLLWGFNVAASIQAKLVDLDKNLELQPDFMREWEISEKRGERT